MLVNHQISKLVLVDPAMSALPVYVLLFFAAAMSMRKTAHQGFLDPGQTGQLKGLAILMIVAGHINLILADGVRVPNFAGFGVSAFLFCSGYGLAVSASETRYTFKGFFTRRASRIYLPYWLVTIAIIAADYLVMGRHYNSGDVALTMLGINLTGFTAWFDLSRWFVTYIVIMYVLFFVSYKLSVDRKRRALLLAAIALLMDAGLVLAYGAYPGVLAPGDVRHYVMYSLMFPAGCLAAVYKTRITSFMEMVINGPAIRVAAVLAVVAFFVIKTLFVDQLRGAFNRVDIGSILFESALWQPAFVVFLTLSLAALAALNQSGLRSRFLIFAGGISYELYLVHFVFMQRYDPLLYRKPFSLYFMVYLAVVFAAAYLLNRSLSPVRRMLGIDRVVETERVI